VPGLIAAFAEQLPEPPVWVAFDTVSQTASGADENDANDMRDYLNAMDRIREATGAYVEAIHHTGKDEARGARGSSVLRANVDTVVQISERDGVAVMRCEKQRGGWAPFKPFAFRVKALALDDHADRTGPVIEACDMPDRNRGEATIPASWRKMLAALAGHPEGTSAGDWQRRTEALDVGKSTFYDNKKRLLDAEFAHEKNGRFYITPAGLELARPESDQKRTGPEHDAA
jgi:hypothetical protein